MKNVFLSGPMTGKPYYNVGAFSEAHQRIMDKIIDGKYLGDVYDPAQEYLSRMVPISHERAIRHSISCLSSGKYDILVLLPGWEDSKGARLERDVAMAIGMEVATLDELEENGRLA